MPSLAMQDLIDTLRKQQLARAGQAPPTLAERRASFVPGGRPHPVPDDVLVTEVNAGGVPAHWLTAPGADPGRVLLFLHGGGFEFGSVRSDGELAARLGRASGMRVLFPEYRLAPEHPFPAAIDDVLAVWRWLRAGQGLSAGSMAVAGDSAGGGLAVSLLVATRDAGEALPAAAVLMSPTVDLTSSGASMTERAEQDPISTPALLRQLASDYLAGADPKTPLASPLFAAMTGLPPLLVLVGTADLLLSDSERLATAAAEAGVNVTLDVGEGLPHVYPIMLGTPEAAEATEQIGTFLRTRVRLSERSCGPGSASQTAVRGDHPMRSDIRPGGTFPDYALPDHTGTVRRLSELQGRDPLVLTLARGNYCPKEHQQHLELAANYPKIAVAYTQVATIATDDHHTVQEFRASVGAQWPFLSDPGRTVQQDLDIAEYTDPEHNPMIPHTLVLKPGLVIHSVYNGYWFWGRPSFYELWRDLRVATSEIRPDWDLATPGLREAWDKGDFSDFHGWDRRAPKSVPTSYT